MALGRCILHSDWYMFTFVAASYQFWLRPGELSTAMRSDVVPLWDENCLGIFRVGKPKISNPPAQHILCESVFIREFFEHFRRSVGCPVGRIFCWSPAMLAAKFHSLMDALHCGGDLPLNVSAKTQNMLTKKFTAAGLRPGAATRDFLLLSNLGRTQWRGRWQSQQTLKNYVQLDLRKLSAVFHSFASRFV